jgi:hypothetical protein
MRHIPSVFALATALATPALAQDLNGNLQQDAAELRAGAPDCNRNGILDAVDISRPHFATALEHLNGVIPSQNNVWDLCPIDFNRDGRPDLALCAFTDTNFGHLALWRNEGGPGLVFHTEIPFPNARPTTIECADLNADGRTDLISGDSSFNRVYILLATGDATFAPAVTLNAEASNNGTGGIAVGDLDADGDIDVAATAWGTNRVNIWRNNGNGTFGPRAGFAADFQPRDVAIGDFTGDGLADLAVANEYYSPSPASANGTVSLLRNTGAAVFVPHATLPMPIGNAPFNYQARPQAVELADLDHDGDTDLITSSKLANTLAIHLNNGSGAFSLGQRFGGFNIEGDVRDVRIADLDADGWEEIIWGDPDQSTAAVYQNNSGVFTLHQDFATATNGSLYLGVADFSGDGRPDIVSANDSARSFSILVNTGDLNFDAPIHLRPDEYPQNLVFADFTGDGVADMGALRSNYQQSVWNIAVYRGLGNAVFSKTPIDTPAPAGIGFLYARDVNNDGIMDLLDLYFRCLAYIGNGDGTFQPAINSNLNVRSIRSVIADLNRDSILDIAWIVAGHPGSYRVSFGNGSGGFGPAASYTMLAEDESVGVGDLNGDGAPELFGGFRQQLAPPLGGVLSMLPNNGDGTFGPRQDRFITASPLNPPVAAIAVADFDADGDGDVVVSASGLRLFRNAGGLALPDTPELVNPSNVSDLFPTDIDLDGDIDLYGRGFTGAAFYNDASGLFAASFFRHYDSNARGFLVADVDNNHRQDLVIRPENSWGTFVFLNHEQASADANANGIPDECEAPPPCAADFNADGALTSQDFFDFLSAFFAGAADFNADGLTNSQDLFDFLAAFFIGC